MLIALLMLASACTALQLCKVRATYGSLVRRSVSSVFLIDANPSASRGKKYAGNITQSGRSNEPNPLYMRLPDQGSNLGPAD